MFQTIIIETKPVPKKRARITRNGNFTPHETEVFERTIKMHCLKNKMFKLDGPIELIINFHFERPKKTKYTYPKRGDVDNYAKSVLDA
jgi:Holliday junction resolvase RusA-like endonuclease